MSTVSSPTALELTAELKDLAWRVVVALDGNPPRDSDERVTLLRDLGSIFRAAGKARDLATFRAEQEKTPAPARL